ncbi:ATP-binding protein [Maridesulfovibrio sp.]|uniref:ATP-binding protein n=1 Tax=Maridesulfovibrio sp. TaxID=2795000 RepID=UPI0039EFC7A3
MSKPKKLRPKERNAIITSLRSGVVPRIGLQHVQVGRALEVKSLIQDIDTVVDGGSSFRMVIGEYGSGKTFFMNLVRTVGLEKKLVTVHADMSPERRFYSSKGQTQALYRELIRNMATRAKPEGGALSSVVEKFISTAIQESRSKGVQTSEVIHERLQSLTEMVGGYDFADVINAYWEGHDSGDEQAKGNAIRWLRGEFTTKTDAKKALGVRTFVDDASMYDHLKILSQFVRLAGYGGLLVCVDEMVNLYKISNSVSRKNNYEQLLRILNDCLQSNCEGLSFLMGGTPDFLLDTRRGLFSYEALQSRLALNTFASGEYVDMSGPVINLANLTPEDMYVLLERLRHVFANGMEDEYAVPDEALAKFLEHCHNTIGQDYFRTPRNTIKAFLDLLAILEQNQEASWQTLLGSVCIEKDCGIVATGDDFSGDEELAKFRI